MPDSTGPAKPRKYAAPRGTADLLPDDWPWWRHVRDTAERVCDLYGYRRIETPIFEHAGIYLRAAAEGTDIVEKEVYLFEDRGGDQLALRPEGTPGVVRAYIEHGMSSLPQPVRLYYIAPNFRYDRPQAGRYRQHTQFGVEAIGDAHPLIDAEILSLLTMFYRELGLRDYTLKLNSIGDANCRPQYVDALRAYYRPKFDQVCEDDRVRFEKNPMRLLDCKDPRCFEIIAGAPRLPDYLCDDCREHFGTLRVYLDALDVRYVLDDRLVRGLDYYTRTAFEMQPEEEAGQSSLGGGGRYDGLAETLGGPAMPGIGFGTGVERLILNLKRQNDQDLMATRINTDPAPRIFIAHVTPAAAPIALQIAQRVRDEGLVALVGGGGRSLKSQMRHADAKGATFVAIIGENELASGTVTLRAMGSHDERRVPIDEVVAVVSP